MSDWIKGNEPTKSGYYWITSSVWGKLSVVLAAYCEDKEWRLVGDKSCGIRFGGSLYSPGIVAYQPLEEPEPYSPDRIGYPDDYYIKIVEKNGSAHYYSKGFLSVSQTKIGYSTIDNAIRAAKRERKLNMQEYPLEPHNYYIVDGNNKLKATVAEDIPQ